MTFFDWLASPLGVDLIHAVIVLLLAAAGWLSYASRSQAVHNEKLLTDHIEQHVMDSASSAAAQPQHVVDPPTPPHNT